MNKKVFFVSPFRPEYEDLYFIIKQVTEEIGANIYRTDELFSSTPIVTLIQEKIREKIRGHHTNFKLKSIFT
jgi:hypothetical protein